MTCNQEMFLLIWTLSCFNYESVLATCGRPAIPPRETRIVGGHEAIQGSLPWMAVLSELDDPTCGGSIINDRIILTAAHCFEDPINRDVTRWKVYVGKHHLTKHDQAEQIHHMQKIIMHEGYNENTVANDIALVFLRDRIQFNSYVSPICLPTGDQVAQVGRHCISAGWGDTRGTGDMNVLNQVTVPIISDILCSKPDWYGYDFLPTTTFCAGFIQGGHDSCIGDSGGPLVCKYLSTWYQMGVTSWGYDCAKPKWPGIYTDVKVYLNWIRGKLALLGYTL